MNRTLGEHKSNSPCSIPVEQNRQGCWKHTGEYIKEMGSLSFWILSQFLDQTIEGSETYLEFLWQLSKYNFTALD